MSKPNIIFLMTDQQRWDCLGVNNPHVLTPNLDKLARTGILYDQAVCQAPMCVPSRNSMLMGLYPSQLGVRSNAGGLFEEDKLVSKPLPEVLNQAGYQTAGFGKTHWNHGMFNRNPSRRGFEIRAEGQPSDSPHYEEGALMMGSDNPEGLAAYMKETAPYGGGEENALGYIGCTSEVAMEDHRDGWVAKQCLKFLDEGLDPERPLFLYLSFLKPHAGLNVPKQFEDMYDIHTIPDIPQPPWLEEPDTHKSVPDARYDEWRKVWSEMTPLERRRTTLRYWANCTWLDHYFGQVLQKLEALGRLDNSLIVYTSDHGEMLGERNFRFSKYCLYDSSVRVPLILSGSVVPEAARGTVDSRPAELVDLFPTLVNSAGEQADPRLPGLDLLGNAKRSGTFCEYHGGGTEQLQPAPAYMWRKKSWKLILFMPGPLKDAVSRLDQIKGELYDLESDPNEWHNLYYDDAHASIREQMKTELLMHLACVWARGPFFYDRHGYDKLGAE